MLNPSRKAKGKRLENYVAKALQKYDQYAYRRADSGSGLHRKEDVFTTLPLFIECKNQDRLQLKTWWKQTINGCPANKYPCLIYKRNYEREPTVMMDMADINKFTGGEDLSRFGMEERKVTFAFELLLNLIEMHNENNK